MPKTAALIALAGSAASRPADFALARHAERVGADMVSSISPYYHRHDERAVVAYFQALAEVVEVLDSGGLALSSGPVLDAKGEWVGTFQSIWRLEPDGRWRVVFDKGCPPCVCGE